MRTPHSENRKPHRIGESAEGRKPTNGLLGLMAQYREDAAPEYPTPPDEFNRFAPVTEPTCDTGRLRRMMLLLAAVGLSLLGLFSLTASNAETYLVQAWHEPPSGAQAYLTVDGSLQTADGLTGVNVPEGAVVRLHYVPNAPYTAADVSLGGTMPEGELYETDDPLAFTVGKGGGVIHFYLNYPSDEPEPDATPEPAATPQPTDAPKPTPNPEPDAMAIYYFTSSVGHAYVTLIDPEHRIVSAHAQIYEESVQDYVLDYELTESDIAMGIVDFGAIELSEFYMKHWDEFTAMGDDFWLHPSLDVTVTYRNPDGSETTITRSCEPASEAWISIRYDDADNLPDDGIYPGCFVVEAYKPGDEAPTLLVANDVDAIENGGASITITINGRVLPSSYCRYVLVTEGEGEEWEFVTPYLIMELPPDFPAHGTAHVQITQTLENFRFTMMREYDLEY